MIDRYGFTAIKLKGGVCPPEEEIEAIKALAPGARHEGTRGTARSAGSPAK
ncbi:hypothetical protein SSPS47_32365 [Streptomyces sp. S4.7]|nr:hypothetical protein SSPS47_32365 [Streptomyces sp. S4.7]